MKILYISSSIVPSREANSIHVMEMCQAFAQNGQEVTLVAPDIKSRYERGVEDVYRYYGVEDCFEIVKLPAPEPLGKAGRLVYALLAARYAMHQKPDLVYGRNPYAIYLAAQAGQLVALDSHGPEYEHGMLARFSLNGLFKNCNFSHLTVNSPALKSLYATNTCLTSDRIHVATNGATIVDSTTLLPYWPGRRDALQVGYIGHLYPGRGVDVIFETAKHLADVDFHVIGGTEKDIVYWQQQVSRPNVFIHGYVSHADVANYRACCDLLLAPYQEQVAVQGGGDTSAFMCPIKILEYMASGKAIIASDLPAVRIILNERNSLLVKSDRVDLWVKAIDQCRDASFREEIVSVAYKDFLNNYTWMKRADKVLAPLDNTY